MRNILLFFTILCFLISCNNYNNKLNEDRNDKKLREKAFRFAEHYSRGQMRYVKKSADKEGIIKLEGKGIVYFIDPSRIVLGEINDDSFKDAIVPLFIYREQTPLRMEHLVLVNKKGKLINIKVFENVLKIIEIKDRIVTAEVSTVASDAPAYGCRICSEVIKYQFTGDTLSIVK